MMGQLHDKYLRELEFVKGLLKSNISDEELLIKIEMAVKAIEKYTWDNYDYNNHLNIVYTLVEDSVYNDGERCKQILEAYLPRKLRVL